MPYRFLCSHCGKSFELDTPAAKECPFCYWSSTVKREDEIAASRRDDVRRPSGIRDRAPSGVGTGLFSSMTTVAGKWILILVLLGGLTSAGYWGYLKFRSSQGKGEKPFSINFSNQEETVPASKPQAPAPLVLSSAEKEILSREISLPVDRDPNPAEKEILNRAVQIQTGWAEKLPSASWTLEQYTQMIAEQERFYKMPFPRSYHKKLEELFKAQYLAGAAAFEKGDLLAARNFWVGSLTFPPYSTDIRKHRAVALTMLRPFINDTLAKIRAMNQGIVDKTKRSQEETLSAEYQKLPVLIGQKKWEEALKMIADLMPQLKALQQGMKLLETPPPYPPSFGEVDADIQQALMDLMTTNPTSAADFQPLQQDLVEKKEILETFTEAYLKNAMAVYQDAMALIQKQQWADALRLLESIAGPQSLQEDAARKVEILKKLLASSTGGRQK